MKKNALRYGYQKSYDEVADHLGVDYMYLSVKCGTSRGSYIAWMCREILCLRWNDLSHTNREILTNILLVVLNNNLGKALPELYDNKLLVFPDPYLNRLAEVLSARAPFASKYTNEGIIDE